MSTYQTVVTNIGLAKIAAAIAGGPDVNLYEMAVGDGNGNPTTPDPAQTALIRERFRAQIQSAVTDPGNPNLMIVDLLVPANQGGWSISEVGVFDDDGALIAVANFPQTYKPQPSEGAARDLVVRVYILFTNASVVNLTIDPSVVTASQSWVQANFNLAVLLPGGTTGQILAKNSNADGDVEWVDPTEVNIVVEIVQEEQTLAASQTIIDLATCTTDGLAVYIEGVREFDFTVNTSTRITLDRSYPAGTKINFVQNDPYGESFFARKDQANTFTQAQTVPNGTAAGHAVNKSQLDAVQALIVSYHAGASSWSKNFGADGNDDVVATFAELFDVGGIYNPTTGEFTIPVAGVYKIAVYMAINTGTNSLTVAMQKNGVDFWTMHTGSTNETIEKTIHMQLAQGDTIRVRAATAGNGTSTLSGGFSVDVPSVMVSKV